MVACDRRATITQHHLVCNDGNSLSQTFPGSSCAASVVQMAALASELDPLETERAGPKEPLARPICPVKVRPDGDNPEP